MRREKVEISLQSGVAGGEEVRPRAYRCCGRHVGRAERVAGGEEARPRAYGLQEVIRVNSKRRSTSRSPKYTLQMPQSTYDSRRSGQLVIMGVPCSSRSMHLSTSSLRTCQRSCIAHG